MERYWVESWLRLEVESGILDECKSVLGQTVADMKSEDGKVLSGSPRDRLFSDAIRLIQKG